MKCVVDAEKIVVKLGELKKDWLKAQITYDQDPDSEAGQEAEVNINDLSSLSGVLRREVLVETQKCAKEISAARLYDAKMQQKEIERLEVLARENARKKFNATMYPDPKTKAKKQEAFVKAQDLKAKADAYMHKLQQQEREGGAGDRTKFGGMSTRVHTRTRTSARTSARARAPHAHAHAQTHARTHAQTHQLLAEGEGSGRH